MFVKAKYMQRFIREKINVDKKKSFLRNIKGARLSKFIKTKSK